jgi:hypothetical protein
VQASPRKLGIIELGIIELGIIELGIIPNPSPSPPWH